ncbi:hypothetical protein DFAR_2300004 [Desulfarculales bacterium]
MVVATADPSFQKKRKLLTAIKALDTDFVPLDLSAGTAITVMNFYLISSLYLAVILPERPAVLNAFNFLKTPFSASWSTSLGAMPPLGPC